VHEGQLEMIVDRLKREFAVSASVSRPTVFYRRGNIVSRQDLKKPADRGGVDEKGLDCARGHGFVVAARRRSDRIDSSDGCAERHELSKHRSVSNIRMGDRDCHT
jgi:hypothetical protein